MNALLHLLDRLVPSQHKHPGTHRKALLLVAILATLVMIVLATTAFEVALTTSLPGGSVIVGGFILVPTAMALRFCRGLEMPAHVLGATMTVANLGVVVLQGGLTAPALPLLLMPPVLVLVLAGRWHGLVWGIVLLTSLGSLAILGDLPPVLPATVPALDHGVPFAATLLCLTLALAFLEVGRDQVEQALTEQTRRAEEATAARSRFLATMSHEIRTPMNGVLGMTDLLAEDTLSPAQAERVEVLKEAGSSLMQLLDDILDLSKLDAGSMSLEHTAVDVAGLARRTARLFHARARSKGLDLVVQAPAELWLIGDELRVRQVLANLVSNAIKFTETGGVTVTVEARGHAWVLQVADTGIGMCRDAVARLFEPFQQADASTTRRFGGTGLGLAIVERLVVAMDGTIDVRSAPGQGTTFEVRLPLHPTERPAPVAPVGQSVAATRRGGLRLLAVEDNAINRKLLEAVLDTLGVGHVDMATDGVEAVAAYRAAAYDLVLMDMQMPRMDGIEATRQIRALETAESRRHTPIVALTANALAEDEAACREVGMDAFLTKPLKKDALAAVLDEIIADAATHTSASLAARWST